MKLKKTNVNLIILSDRKISKKDSFSFIVSLSAVHQFLIAKGIEN